MATAQWSVETIDVDDIKPGMKGYGLSVFRGTKPDRFDVEVIDVLHGFRPNQDLILIKTPHPLLDRARGVGGMSGSPIYLNGKLAGAYAYGWPFGSDPVVGVTPIASMLAELKRPIRPASSKRFSARRLKETTAFTVANEYAKRIDAELAPIGLRRATTPLMISGFTDSVAKMLGQEFRKLGLVPTQAGGTSRLDDNAPRNYEAGGAVAVELATGDVSMSGVGTITYVGTKGRVLGFGHPMMNAGQVNLPTAIARVLHVLVSDQRSFKIAEAVRPLGSLVHDRQSTIVIDTRIKPMQIPVHVRIRGVKGAPKTVWNAKIADHPALTPMIAFSVIANALKATASDQTDVIYKATTRIGIRGHGIIKLQDHGFVMDGPSSPRMLSQLRLFGLMDAAYDNAFETSGVTSIDVDLDVEFSRDVLQVTDVSVSSEEVDPGSTLPVYVRLRRVDRAEETRVFSLKIPKSAAGSKVQIVVQPGPQVTLPVADPKSFKQLIEIVKTGYPATSLVASLNLPSYGLKFRGHVVESLPPSAVDALRGRQISSSPRAFSTQSHQELKMNKLVMGGGKLTIQVREFTRKQMTGDKK